MPLKSSFSTKRTNDLDLAYIKPNIIAMGFPYENFEGMFKGHGMRMEDVVRFLDSHHPNHYRVYNLCSERSYDSSKFHMRAITYPFDFHCPPPFELIQQFCEDVSMHLKADDRNVAVVHCCNGVERTGVMICSYLLHDQIFYSTKDALNFFAAARTRNGLGVIIPSQRRYVQYYGYMLKNNFIYFPNAVFLHSLKFIGTPCPQGATCSTFFTISVQRVKAYTSKVYGNIKKSDQATEFMLPQWVPLCGDVTIEFLYHTRFGGKENLFSFCFNTYFVDMHLLLQQHQQRCTQMPLMHKRSASTSCLDHTDSDSYTSDVSKVPDKTKNDFPLSAVPSHLEFLETKKSSSLNDVHATANDMAPIKYEQHNTNGSVVGMPSNSRNTKPKVQRTQSSFQMFDKKTIPGDRHLRRALKKAGKHAGVDITTGFTTVVHKPVEHHRAPRRLPQDIQYNPRLTLSPMRRLRSTTSVEKITGNPPNDIAGALPISASINIDDSVKDYELVTITLPLSELDHATKDKKCFPDDFQLHVVLLVETELIKDVEYDEYFEQ